MRGFVRMDLALGDAVEAVVTPLKKIEYRGTPLAGKVFEILAYPPESIFSEKYYIAVSRGGNNTRMKDFYDLHKLCRSETLNPNKLKKALDATFQKRGARMPLSMEWNRQDVDKLQVLWASFLKKEALEDVPRQIEEIIAGINTKLKETFPTQP
jgi:hypothetical protein